MLSPSEQSIAASAAPTKDADQYAAGA